MKIVFLVLTLSFISIAQTQSLNLRGTDIELGMNAKLVWDLIGSDLNVIEDDEGNMYITDKNDNTIGIIFFKNEIVVRVAKDWGTSYKSNVGQVFKTLWKILNQYKEELNNIKIDPMETFTPKGEQNTLRFYINDYKYIDIIIQNTVSIFEVIEEPEN